MYSHKLSQYKNKLNILAQLFRKMLFYIKPNTISIGISGITDHPL